MNSKLGIRWLIGLAALSCLFLHAQQKSDATFWLTTADRSALFAQQDTPLRFSKSANQNPTITIDDKQRFQSIDGFGFAMTGGSSQLLTRMDPTKRAAILKELFATDGTNIGLSYLRVSIGSSDMNDHVYSYDDLSPGQTDPSLAKFSLDPDRADVIPVLKEVLAINPKIKILGSPWSPPAWMKTNDDSKGGNLKREYYGAYAQYFVKYILGMRAGGIRIDAITVQNEPLNENNTPSMQLLAPDEASFIKNYLGPAFKAAGIDTKIILYDHNCDLPEYPLSILKDPEAGKYVDGSGFHLYEGPISAMSVVHDAFPDKNLYFTEYMAVEPSDNPTLFIAKHVHGTVLGALNNWSRNVLLWNLAADANFGPHTSNGGCGVCQGAITIEGNDVTRNLAYYTIAHFSKFVRPGSVRIASSSPESLPNAAFVSPEKKVVLVVANDSQISQAFSISFHHKVLKTTLDPGSVGTYVWSSAL